MPRGIGAGESRRHREEDIISQTADVATENRKALGRWPNAPLALVLAQVRFKPTSETVPQLIVERIQHQFGGSLPRVVPIRQVTVLLGQTAQTQVAEQATVDVGFDMRDEVNAEAVRIQPDALTFMTSAYVDSGHFAAQWAGFMSALCGGGELHVTRLGLRYVDFIIPSAGHVPEDYFKDLGQSPRALGQPAPVAFNLYEYARENGGRLRLQYTRGSGTPALPSDLQDTVVPPSQLATKNAGDVSAVLDMDRWRPVNELMAADVASDSLLALREDLASSFRSIMTELAETEWNPPQ